MLYSPEELPEEIGKLTNLENIDLEGNLLNKRQIKRLKKMLLVK